MFFWISCQWSLYSSLLAHPAEAYPSFLSIPIEFWMFYWISCQWSLYSSLLAHPAEAYPSFLNRKRLVLLGYDASQSQGLPPAFYQAFLTISQYPLILLGEERHCESEVFCPRTQHIDTARSWTQTSGPKVQCIDHYATVSLKLQP